MSWTSAIPFAFWGWLALVPIGVVLLYFLKLRREPVEVPSTFLWARTIEDIHVNSLIQRLRRNLLLFLQLLALAVAGMALMQPHHAGESKELGRAVFLLDSSASMLATDVQGDANRFEKAKRLIGERIDDMTDRDVAMLITFNDRAEVLQSFTSDRRRLRDALDGAKVTQRRTDILGALKAADGLANPRRTSEAGTMDFQVADAQPADLYYFSDGRFPKVKDFDLGNLKPNYIKIGTEKTKNIAITAFSAERDVENPSQIQAYATIVNFSDEPINTSVSLFVEDAFEDATSINLDAAKRITPVAPKAPPKPEPAEGEDAEKLSPEAAAEIAALEEVFDTQSRVEGEQIGVSFSLEREDAVSLRVELEESDDFMLDNIAYAGLTPMRTVSVLILTSGNVPLEKGLTTENAAKICNTEFRATGYLATDEYKTRAEAGVDDLIIYDRCVPEKMPPTNTFFIGSLPPQGWKWNTDPGLVNIIDVDRTHPIMRYLEMFSVLISSGRAVEGPVGSQVLAEADLGPVLAIAPRDGYQDLVLGYEIMSTDDDGSSLPNTTWYAERSWPVFVLNVLRYLAGAAEASGAPSYHPGETVRARVESAVPEVFVSRVGSDPTKMRTSASGQVEIIETNEPGNYRIDSEDKLLGMFSINLFDQRESNLGVINRINIGHASFEGAVGGVEVRREYWRLVLIGVLLLLGLEWWLYSRRVA